MTLSELNDNKTMDDKTKKVNDACKKRDWIIEKKISKIQDNRRLMFLVSNLRQS